MIDLTYYDEDNNEKPYKNNDRLILNITDPNTISKFVSRIFENYVVKHVTFTSKRISFLTDYYSSGPKTRCEWIILAKQMAHSVEEQLQYMKILNLIIIWIKIKILWFIFFIFFYSFFIFFWSWKSNFYHGFL